MLRNAPKFHEVAKRIVEITEDCIIVAHNAHFDYRILRTEFRRLGYPFKRKSVCTVEVAERLMPNEESYSLGKLSRSLGIPISDRHRAEGDAIATVKLFKILLSKDLDKSIIKETINVNEAIELSQNHKDIIEGLPSETGMFYFYDNKGKIFFIGRSKNIKHKVSQYLTDDRSKSKKMQKWVSRVKYEKTGNELIAQLKLKEELAKHRPFLNSNKRRPTFTHALYKHTDDQGYLNLYVARYDEEKEVISTFANLHSGKQFLKKVIEDNNFCKNKIGKQDPDGDCENYKQNLCLGACAGEESSEDYNKRVLGVLENITYQNRSLAIIDKGRELHEKSIVYIKDGAFKGYGYFNLNHQINNNEILKKIITPMKNSKEANHIIMGSLRKNNFKKIIELN